MQCIIILASNEGSGRLRENGKAALKCRSSTASKRIRADIDLASCRGRKGHGEAAHAGVPAIL